MPFLKPDIDLFPDGLLERPCVETPGDKRWWVLTALPRRGKEVMRALRRDSLSFYAPLIPQKHRTPKGRIVTAYMPLFPNYIFFHGDKSTDLNVLIWGKLAGCLPVPDPAGLIRDLRRIKHLLALGVPLTLEKQLHQGDRARIRTGLWKGYEGTLIREPGRNRLVINIELIQAAVSFENDDFQFEIVAKFVPRPEDVAESRKAERRQKARDNPPPVKVQPKGKRRSGVSPVSRDAQSAERSAKVQNPVSRDAQSSERSAAVKTPVSRDAQSSERSAGPEKKSLLEFRRSYLESKQKMTESKVTDVHN